MKMLGIGVFSKVKLVVYIFMGQKVVIKIMNCYKMCDMEEKGVYYKFFLCF